MVVSINAHQAGYLYHAVYHLPGGSGRYGRLIGNLPWWCHERSCDITV